MNFAFYWKSDFEKKTILSRMMTSHQISFENVENLLKLIVDKICKISWAAEL